MKTSSSGKRSGRRTKKSRKNSLVEHQQQQQQQQQQSTEDERDDDEIGVDMEDDEDEDATSASSLSVEMMTEMLDLDETEGVDETAASIPNATSASASNTTTDVVVKMETDSRDERTLVGDATQSATENGLIEGNQTEFIDGDSSTTTTTTTNNARKRKADDNVGESSRLNPIARDEVLMTQTDITATSADVASSADLNAIGQYSSNSVMSKEKKNPKETQTKMGKSKNIASSWTAVSPSKGSTASNVISTPSSAGGTRRSRRRAAEEARQSINDVTKHLKDAREETVDAAEDEDVLSKSGAMDERGGVRMDSL